MECRDVPPLISAAIDGESPAEERAALEAHLSVCAECRAAAELVRAQDAALRQAFRPRREAAAEIAVRVARSWPRDNVPASAVGRSSGVRWASHLLALALGFLLAVILFRPWSGAAMQAKSQAPDAAPPQRSVVARLVAATGEIAVRSPAAAEWRAPASLAVLGCPPDGSVRTGPEARCELVTARGGVVRMDCDTELTFRSAETVALHKGQVWCRSPESAALRVLVEQPEGSERPPAPAPGNAAAPIFHCTANSSLLTEVQPGGQVQVTSAQGNVEVRTALHRRQLRSGETAVVRDGEIAPSDQWHDPLLAARWMHPLLMRKGHSDKELESRVNELLARLGQSKLSLLYEREIRSLGEYAVLPLLRFVQSPLSQSDRPQRMQAMRILADIAPNWAVPELIALLPDDDPGVRCAAATALERLTGQTQGREPDQWQADWSECAESYALWQQWWEQNRPFYPSPPVLIARQ